MSSVDGASSFGVAVSPMQVTSDWHLIMENIGAPTMARPYEQYLGDLAAEKEANDVTRHSCVCNCMLCTEGKPLPCLPPRHIDKNKAKGIRNGKTYKERIAFMAHIQEKIPSGPHVRTWPREYEE